MLKMLYVCYFFGFNLEWEGEINLAGDAEDPRLNRNK